MIYFPRRVYSYTISYKDTFVKSVVNKLLHFSFYEQAHLRIKLNGVAPVF